MVVVGRGEELPAQVHPLVVCLALPVHVQKLAAALNKASVLLAWQPGSGAAPALGRVMLSSAVPAGGAARGSASGVSLEAGALAFIDAPRRFSIDNSLVSSPPNPRSSSAGMGGAAGVRRLPSAPEGLPEAAPAPTPPHSAGVAAGKDAEARVGEDANGASGSPALALASRTLSEPLPPRILVAEDNPVNQKVCARMGRAPNRGELWGRLLPLP